MQRHRENEKYEIEIVKLLSEEIRFNRNQIWKVTYYCIIIYAGLFTIINLFKNKLEGDLSWVGMFYYTMIFLTASISYKIVDKLYNNNFAHRRYFEELARITNDNSRKNYKPRTNFRITDNEQYFGTFFVIIFGCIISIIYVNTIYGFRKGLYIAIFTYFVIEGMLIYIRRKTFRLVMEDINFNIILFSLLYAMYTISKVKILTTETIQYLNKPF
jgi:hypothetical protein